MEPCQSNQDNLCGEARCADHACGYLDGPLEARMVCVNEVQQEGYLVPSRQGEDGGKVRVPRDHHVRAIPNLLPSEARNLEEQCPPHLCQETTADELHVPHLCQTIFAQPLLATR